MKSIEKDYLGKDVNLIIEIPKGYVIWKKIIQEKLYIVLLIKVWRWITMQKGNLEVRYFDDHVSYTPVCGVDIVTSKWSDNEIVLLHDGN